MTDLGLDPDSPPPPLPGGHQLVHTVVHPPVGAGAQHSPTVWLLPKSPLRLHVQAPYSQGAHA